MGQLPARMHAMTEQQPFRLDQQAALESITDLLEKLAAACLLSQLRIARLELLLKAHKISTDQEMDALDRAATWQWQTGRMPDAVLGPDITELVNEARRRVRGEGSA